MNILVAPSGLTGESEGLGLSRSEPDSFEAIDRASDEMREIAERWQDRLAVEGHTIAENYAEGRLSIILDLHISAPIAGDRMGLSADESPFLNREVFASAVYTCDVPNKRDIFLGNQQPVLVFDVEGVQSPDGITTPSFVRLYGIHDKVDDVFGGLMFQSTVDGVYKFLPGVANWKCRTMMTFPSSVELNVADSVIKRGPEVVNSITDGEKDGFCNILGDGNVQRAIRSVRIVLDQNTVNASAMKDSGLNVQVVDVLIGPFDL
jgi:hypothetical protein